MNCQAFTFTSVETLEALFPQSGKSQGNSNFLLYNKSVKIVFSDFSRFYWLLFWTWQCSLSKLISIDLCPTKIWTLLPWKQTRMQTTKRSISKDANVISNMLHSITITVSENCFMVSEKSGSVFFSRWVGTLKGAQTAIRTRTFLLSFEFTH